MPPPRPHSCLQSLWLSLTVLLCVPVGRCVADQAGRLDPALTSSVDASLRAGAQHLKRLQDSKGWWSSGDHPSITALALVALMHSGEPAIQDSEVVRNGYRYLEDSVRPDGGIYVAALPNYNTSLSLVALVAAGRPEYAPIIRRARAFVAGMQSTGPDSDPYSGGIGYSHDDHRADLNNTTVALEALIVSQHPEASRDSSPERSINWNAALRFIQRCQNLPTVNDQAWAGSNPEDVGGFVYDPGSTKSQVSTNRQGRVALRSYGSISYAGLLSYAHASLKRDDPRVVAVVEWLQKNVTFTENPGLGDEGYYYYLQMMCKALQAAGIDTLNAADGRVVVWRNEVSRALVARQSPEGGWVNKSGRWWEKDPALVTSYAMIALEICRGR